MSSASDASPTQLAKSIEEYLAEYPAAAVLEDGRVLFDMRMSRYSITESHGRCLLQLWSEERNVVRTVLELQHRAQSLRVMTRRMGAPKPQALELVPSSDRRTPTARDSARRNYQRLLERVLTRVFLGAKVDGFLHRHGGKAVLLGRLTAVLRALMPSMAGMSGMRYRTFLLWNATGGLIWAPGCVLLGYAFSSALGVVGETLTWAPLAILAVAIVIYAGLHIRKRRIEAAEAAAFAEADAQAASPEV